MVQDVSAIGDIEGHPHVLLDHQHTAPGLIGDVANDREESLDDDRREAEAQFVDEQTPRLGDERSRHGEHLLLTTGEQARLAPTERAQRRKQIHRAIVCRAA